MGAGDVEGHGCETFEFVQLCGLGCVRVGLVGCGEGARCRLCMRAGVGACIHAHARDACSVPRPV